MLPGKQSGGQRGSVDPGEQVKTVVACLVVVCLGLTVVGSTLLGGWVGLDVGLGHLESRGFSSQLGGHLGSLSEPAFEQENSVVVSGGRYVGG